MQIKLPKKIGFELDEYQSEMLSNWAFERDICNRILIQYPTGGGKTVIFSVICASLLDLYPNYKILILVHRKELLKSFADKIIDLYGIIPTTIEAGKPYKSYLSNVVVGMVETFKSREAIKQNFDYIIIDEAHRGEFFKVLEDEDLKNKFILGFTATPISASKKKPLNTLYKRLLVGPTIPELIKKNRLVRVKVFEPENVLEEISKLKKKWTPNGFDYDPQEVSKYFSQEKKVKTIYNCWVNICNKKRTMVFCASISHAEKVYDYFKEKGAEHLLLVHSKNTEDRNNLYNFVDMYDDGVIINIDMLTTGVDLPVIQNLIIGITTLSLTLFLQITGRAIRAYEGKEFATMVDLGANTHIHGEPHWARDWDTIFENPQKKIEPFMQVCSCFECGFIQDKKNEFCEDCGIQIKKPKTKREAEIEYYEEEAKGIGFTLFNNYKINIKTIMESVDKKRNSPFRAFYLIAESLILRLLKEKKISGRKEISTQEVTIFWELYVRDVVAEWDKQNPKKRYGHEFLEARFMEKIKEVFKKNNIEIVEVLKEVEATEPKKNNFENFELINQIFG